MAVVNKKKLFVICLFIISTIIALFSYSNYKEYKKVQNYREIIRSTVTVKSSDFDDLINSEPQNIYIFFGRETCPSCVDLLNKKSVQVFFKNNDIYYINTEKTDKDSILKSIRVKYKIDFVPSILHIQKDSIEQINVNNI